MITRPRSRLVGALRSKKAERLHLLCTAAVACACACAGAPVRDGVAEPSAHEHAASPLPPPRAAPSSPPADRLAWARRLQAEPDPGVRGASCARELAIEQPWTDCEARSCGPQAVILEATLECGADSCDGHAYVLTERGQVAALPYGGHKACSPDGAFVVSDIQLVPMSEEALVDPRQRPVVLHRYPVDGSAPAPFADCMSPFLPPDGESFLCRDRTGALLQVGLGGGATTRVAESGVLPEQVEYNPPSYVYPTPPRWVDGVIRFAVETTDGPIELGVQWPPPPGTAKNTLPQSQPDADAKPVIAKPVPKGRRRPDPPPMVPKDPCGAWLCDDEGNCYAPNPKNCLR